MAKVTVTFNTSSANVQVEFRLAGQLQPVDTSNSPLVYPNMAPGQYAMQTMVSTKDGDVKGGESCGTVVTEAGQGGPIGEIPALLNTISMGSKSDTASSSFTVV